MALSNAERQAKFRAARAARVERDRLVWEVAAFLFVRADDGTREAVERQWPDIGRDLRECGE